MALRSELRCEFVELVGRVRAASQEDYGLPGTTPVKHLQSDVLIYSYEADSVG
jgi:hypothetical protein